jgi:acetylornithine aminotransferase
LFGPGDHGTTFAPSPLSASLGNAVLDCLLDDGVLEAAKGAIDYLWKKLSELADQSTFIGEIRGKGMMIGIVTGGTPEQVQALRQKMQASGILIDITQKTIIRLLPPLTLTYDEIDQFVQLLNEKLNEVFN